MLEHAELLLEVVRRLDAGDEIQFGLQRRGTQLVDRGAVEAARIERAHLPAGVRRRALAGVRGRRVGVEDLVQLGLVPVGEFAERTER